MAPELLLKRGDYSGPAADIWATGVVLYTLLTGCFPFRGKDEKQLFRKITEGVMPKNQLISLRANELLGCLMDINADRRLTA